MNSYTTKVEVIICGDGVRFTIQADAMQVFLATPVCCAGPMGHDGNGEGAYLWYVGYAKERGLSGSSDPRPLWA